MGMANPQNWTYRMTCCDHFTPWLPPSEQQRGADNEGFDVDECPNRYCPTNR